jgi:exosortase E/protease (VPEID-CTERM system)
MVFFLLALVVARWAPAGTAGERAPFGASRALLWRMLPIQIGLYLVFMELTLFVFEGKALPHHAFLPLVAWIASGLGVAVFWCLAAMPVRAWARLVVRCSPFLAPCAILAGLSVVSGTLATRTWEPLVGWTFILVGDVLRWLGQDVVWSTANMVISVKGFSAAIYPYCSGYEGIGLMVLFVGSFLWFFRSRLRFPRAFLLFPLGALAIWLVNVLRIAALILIGAYVSPRLAGEGFHSNIGWLGFIAVSLGMVALAQKTPFFSRLRPGARTLATGPATRYLAPLMVLLGSGLVTGLFTSGFDLYYPVRTVAAAAAVWYFWRHLRPLALLSGLSWQPFAIGVLVYAFWTALEPAAGGPGALAFARGLTAMPAGLSVAWLFFRVAGSVLVVPAVEELAFRGYLLRRLSQGASSGLRFSWLPFLLSSALFAAMHGRWLAGFLAGACYAWSMYRRDRVFDAFISHAVTNGLIACEVLLLGHYRLWT